MNEALTRSAVSNLKAERPLRLDRRFLLFTLLAALLLSWPLLVFGRASYSQDSAAYYKGGRAAVEFALTKFGVTSATPHRPAEQASTPASEAESVSKEVRGVRSITYSVASYLLSAPQAKLLLLVIAQALAAGVVIVATLGAFGGLPVRRTTVALLVLAVATTVAPVSYFAVPDIFAGLLIGTMVLLTVAGNRLSLGVRLLCAGIATFAVTAHASHIPIALGMAGLGIGWIAFKRYHGDPLPKWTWVWVITPLAIGCLTVLAFNRVAFGETSLTSKRFPFALSRSVNDGPGRWYLEKNCPHLKYTICKLYPNGLPKGGALEFLWGKDGVVERATPAQMDQIRAEESEIVLAAAREYSGYEARRLAYNIARQLFRFRPFPFEADLVKDDSGTPQLVWGRHPNQGMIIVMGFLMATSAAIGTAWLGWNFIKKPASRPIVALVYLGILGNALTCTVLAAVAQRYNARVIWLIPLFALALTPAFENRNSRGRGTIEEKPDDVR